MANWIVKKSLKWKMTKTGSHSYLFYGLKHKYAWYHPKTETYLHLSGETVKLAKFKNKEEAMAEAKGSVDNPDRYNFKAIEVD